MSTSGRGELRVGVRIGAGVWSEEIERYGQGSAARVAAERERPALERVGIGLSTLMPCDPEGPDGTRLGGLVKAYVPISSRPPSERPFAFVLGPGRDELGRYLALVAFGERHPQQAATRSVYERAHKRLYGRYSDQ